MYEQNQMQEQKQMQKKTYATIKSEASTLEQEQNQLQIRITTKSVTYQIGNSNQRISSIERKKQ
jgi:ribosomal protein L18